SAAARRDKPPSTAAINRERKSSDMDFVMPGWPPRPAGRVNQIFQLKGIPLDSVRSDNALALLWQNCDFWDSHRSKSVIHREPAFVEAGDGNGLAGRTG
ncbi:MAG TPA: hypothetical protein VF503_02455, partial [Sphingobium sp.]|uniref:hypothetical protein n=1 Tax=Sphingobium sp. TaxID=1912891 RepID=UPI002ED37C58